MSIPGTPSAIEAARTIEFKNSVSFQLNEQPGKFRPLCGSSDSYSDVSARIDNRFDDLIAEDVNTRNGDTRNTDLDYEGRYILKPKRQNLAPLLDRDDMMATSLDLKSPAATAVARAIRRAQDRRFLEGFYGTAYSGTTAPTTSIPFKSANILAADTGSSGTPAGITKNKLIAVKEAMALADIDLETEMPIWIVTPKQVSDLLKINEVASRDYNPQVTLSLQNGKVTDFMGFRFVQANLGSTRAYGTASALTVDGSGYRCCPVFVPSGMHFGVWEDFFGRVEERGDKNYSWQIYGETCGTATRLNEAKCFQVKCVES